MRCIKKRSSFIIEKVQSIKTIMSSSAIASLYTYDILLEVQPDGTYQASVWGLDCRAVATTAAEAIAKVKEQLSDRLMKAQIVRVEIPPVHPDTVPSDPHPWMPFAGMFADDPDFDAVQADIAAYRQDLDEKEGDR
jgi:hypothetical protein